nr:hypothetical protein [Tanacetum cinerariifolium]
STVSSLDNTANLSDATVYAFLANQPNGSQLVHEDLEKIHKDDLEEMDLKWQLALLSMRAIRYFQRTGKKIIINRSDTTGYDKRKVECFNCHKMVHFTRECKSLRSQESRPRNQGNSRKTVIVEDRSSKAMVAIDGAGFDWSYMVDDEVPTNMAFSDSEKNNLSSTKRMSDATVYAFLANQPNGSQLVHEDLEKIHKDDLEEMDLKWQLALLSMRAIRYFQRTGKKIIINRSDTTGYDKRKVECFNCHKMVHFTRECKSLRSQESRPRNQGNSRKTVIVEDRSSKAMVAIDGAGFDWSYMVDDEVPTNMAFSDSEVHNSKTCSNTCLKSFETLKNQYDNLIIELNKSEFDLAAYKRGLSKSLDKLIGSQITDNSKTGLGFTSYNVVAPPPTGLFAPPTIDLSSFGLEEFKQPEFESYRPKASKNVCVDITNVIKKASNAPNN